MEDNLLERVAALLREEGFAHIEKRTSVHSATLAAEKGETRVVFHLNEGDQVPSNAGHNTETPLPTKIRSTAALLGAKPTAEGQPVQKAGQSGGPKKQGHPKR